MAGYKFNGHDYSELYVPLYEIVYGHKPPEDAKLEDAALEDQLIHMIRDLGWHSANLEDEEIGAEKCEMVGLGREVLTSYLKALIKENVGISPEYNVVFKALLRVKDDYIFFQFYSNLVTMMWS